MKEEEIRPKELTEKLKEYLNRDRALWLSGNERFIRIPCPACESDEVNKQFSVRKLSFEICSNCNTVFYNPRPTEETLSEYYQKAENYTFWAKYIFPASESARREKIFLPRVEEVLNYFSKYNSDSEVLLEIGAGFGIFCEEIHKREIFNQVIAVEPTPHLADVCRCRGLNTLESTYENLKLENNSVDCICSFEVIEHLFSPLSFVKKCFNLLKTGGLFIITCPNIKGFDFEVLGYDKAINFGLEHINMFHPKSIRLLFESVGFNIVDIKTPGKLDAELVRNQYLEGNIDFQDNPFLKRILVDDWEKLGSKFQQFLSDNELSSNMLIVATK